MQTIAPERLLLIAAMTLAVNLLLFAGLPNLLPKKAVSTPTEQPCTVDLLTEPPRPKSARKEKRPEAISPEQARVAPRKTITAVSMKMPQQVSMQLPSFDLDAMPAMNLDVPITQPADPLPSAVAVPKEFYGLEEVDQAPVATTKNRPVYPYRARRLNLEGEVDVKFLVDTQGRVSRIGIVRATPATVFNQSVVQALASWRFDPGTVGGRPVNTWVTTTIVFRMDDL